MAIRDLSSWHRYLRFWRSNVGADVDAEIAFHVDARTAELIESGLGMAEARTRALEEFGDVERARLVLRTMDEQYETRRRRIEILADLWQDVRVAIRSLRRTPGFVTVVALTLALGIGLNTAIYSIVDAYLFRPIPVPNGKELVVLAQTDAALAAPHELSYPNYLDYRSDTTIFRGLAAYTLNAMNLGGVSGAPAERIWTQEATANFFDVLGVKPYRGRLFEPGEDVGELAHPIIVLTYDFWQSHFGGRASVVGDTVRLNGHIVEIVGVTPPGFEGVDALLGVSGFTPLNQTWPSFHNALRERGNSIVYVVGTLRPGVSLERATQAVQAKAKTLERTYPKDLRGVNAILARETRTRPNISVSANTPRIAAAFMLLVLLVLGVACANVASLLLARSTAHFREHAIRVALGASRWRLARRVLVECLILATIGGAGAILLATVAVRALSTIRVAADVPIRWRLAVDERVLTFTLLIAFATAIFAAIAPVLSLRRTNVTDALKSGARGSTGAAQRLRTALVIAQIAVCLTIVVAAALFARSTANAMRINPGFRTDHVLMATMAIGTNGYDSTRGKEFYKEVQRRVSALPGVRSVAFARNTPFGYNNEIVYAHPELSSETIPENGVGMFSTIVSPEYFTTMGMPILEGRGFSLHDDESSLEVAVITKRFAERVWPNQAAIGKRFRVDDDSALVQVVGVVGDIQYFMLGETPKPFVFLAATQRYRGQMTVNVHTSVDPRSLINSVRAAIQGIDPTLPVFDVRSLDEHIRGGRALIGPRLGAMFSGVFGALALVLAAVGLYGLMSYSVVQRTREIGIRVALGARGSEVLGLVVRHGTLVTVVGVVAGLAIALGITQLLSRLLYGVAPHDPLILGGVALALVLVGAAASAVPARRAARVDPLTALRAD